MTRREHDEISKTSAGPEKDGGQKTRVEIVTTYLCFTAEY
jgi:hypothetical protein